MRESAIFFFLWGAFFSSSVIQQTLVRLCEEGCNKVSASVDNCERQKNAQVWIFVKDNFLFCLLGGYFLIGCTIGCGMFSSTSAGEDECACGHE